MLETLTTSAMESYHMEVSINCVWTYSVTTTVSSKTSMFSSH